MPSDLSKDRKLIDGRWVRWNAERAASAYARGLWVRDTLADCLRTGRSGRRRSEWCSSMAIAVLTAMASSAQATALAQRHAEARSRAGSVVSFMLPNWHEAAVIYMAATLAGMVVNPILPSLRDRELLFILKDVESRLVFVPSALRQHDYARDDEPRDRANGIAA